ncbi:anaerobic ribonucleoside-triphosphate reductase activating protein [Spirochaetia bacterium]|nr:anaerobic ribonucleoside-triphosphate reductase activating protein [Spirochaetia bacterium]
MNNSSFNQKVILRKTSLVDYPEKVAAVLFFPFCNLRCPWCHNRELVLNEIPEGEKDFIALNDALMHIEKRRAVLGGVVLSGGEPTLFKDLPLLIKYIKSINLAVKLDTNGTNPDMLKMLFSEIETSPDYIACDLKIAPERYVQLSSGTDAEKLPVFLTTSVQLIRASGIAHEFRSLNLPSPFWTDADKAALAPLALDSVWNFRPFVPGNCLDPEWNNKCNGKN